MQVDSKPTNINNFGGLTRVDINPTRWTRANTSARKKGRVTGIKWKSGSIQERRFYEILAPYCKIDHLIKLWVKGRDAKWVEPWYIKTQTHFYRFEFGFGSKSDMDVCIIWKSNINLERGSYYGFRNAVTCGVHYLVRLANENFKLDFLYIQVGLLSDIRLKEGNFYM